MEYRKTLIIFDWDDTLFPTHWLFNNNIKLDNAQDIRRYLLYFQELDKVSYKLLQHALQYGKVLIVTNANKDWVEQSSRYLSNTQKLLQEKILVVSARDLYQKTHTINSWKIMTFNNEIYKFIRNASQIVSIGDADYEHNALISLKQEIDKKNLKMIRLTKLPEFDVLLDQINILNNAMPEIIQMRNHLDLSFTPT